MIARVSKGVHAGGDRGAGIDGLLVENRRRHSALEKAVGADGSEISVGGLLDAHQPFEGTETGGDHRRVAGPRSGGNQRLRESGVAVRDAVLAPRPIGTIGAPEEAEKALPDGASGCLDAAVTLEHVQVSLDAEQRIRPRAGTAETVDGGKGGVEQLTGEAGASRICRASH